MQRVLKTSAAAVLTVLIFQIDSIVRTALTERRLSKQIPVERLKNLRNLEKLKKGKRKILKQDLREKKIQVPVLFLSVNPDSEQQLSVPNKNSLLWVVHLTCFIQIGFISIII